MYRKERAQIPLSSVAAGGGILARYDETAVGIQDVMLTALRDGLRCTTVCTVVQFVRIHAPPGCRQQKERSRFLSEGCGICIGSSFQICGLPGQITVSTGTSAPSDTAVYAETTPSVSCGKRTLPP